MKTPGTRHQTPPISNIGTSAAEKLQAPSSSENNVERESLERGASKRLKAKGFIPIAIIAAVWQAAALDIQLPPESAAFKQDTGVEIANGQCLICHSVEYVTMQPPMQRAFWKSSVVKMQQKYGAPITDAQIDPVVDYLTRNYGVNTNSAQQVATIQTRTDSGTGREKLEGAQVAAKYFCLSCHSPAAKVGPQYRDIAAKYKNDPNALARIDEQIHKGGTGKWGPIIMPPFPQVNAAETKALAEWILATK